MYYHVCSFHDYQDDTVSNLLGAWELEALANYLSQWDYGDNYGEASEAPWGRNDTVREFGQYALVVNRNLGYADLYLKSEVE